MSYSKILLIVLFLMLLVSCQNHSRRKVVKQLYANGVIKEEYEINLDSLKDGYYKSYDSLGRLILTANFKKGIQNGVQKEYYNNGKILNIGYFSNGLLDSGKAFDSLGHFDSNIWPSYFYGNKDTIHPGEVYKANISLRGIKNLNNASIEISFFKKEDYINRFNGKLVHGTAIKDSFHKYYFLQHKFDSAGYYVLDGIISFQENGKVNASAIEHDVFVLP